MVELHPDLKRRLINTPVNDDGEQIAEIKFIHHPLVIMPYGGHPQETELANNTYLLKRASLDKETDPVKAVNLFEKPYMLGLINDLWREGCIDQAQLNELLRENWTLIEFPSIDDALDSRSAIINLFRAAGYVTDGPEQFDRPRCVFRGGDRHGLSWTMAWRTALFFADRFQQDKPLWVALAPEGAVLGRFIGRNEEEVVVDVSLLEEVAELDKDDVPPAEYRRQPIIIREGSTA